MRTKDRISLGLSALALAASVLILGGALWWAQTIVAALVALALAMQLTTRRRLVRMSPLLVLLGLATTWTALQLVPLPNALLSALNPTGVGLRHDGAALLGTSPLPTITLDPPTTVRALSYFLTLLGTAVLALRLAASERGRFYLISGVACACGLAAVLTALHALFDVTAVYGLYEPHQAAPPILGPLLNPNHLGGLMALGSTLSVGLTFYHRQSSHFRALWLLNAIGCALIAVASESRGALIALVLGTVATLAMLVGARVTASESGRHTRRRLGGQDLSVFLVVAIALGIAVYTSAGDVATEIDNTSFTDVEHPLNKFGAWKSSTALVAESPWFGVGRGAIEATLTRVHQASAYATFSHLENEYVSSIVEWGVPGALLALAALGWCVASALRRWRDSALAAAALGGMLGVLFQSSVDFGIQLLGLAVPATVVAATVLLVPFRESSPSPQTRVIRASLVAAIMTGGLVLIPSWARTVGEDHQRLPTASLDEVREIAQRHPLDYLVFARASELTAAKDFARAVQLINHSMRLHPSHSGLHRLAARLLLARGRNAQAALEYRLALRGTLTPGPLLHEIVTTLSPPEHAATAIPVEWQPYEQVLQELADMGRNDVAIAWLRRVVEPSQTTTLMIDRLYDMAMLNHDLDAAAFAAFRRMATADTGTSRWMLAKVEYKRAHYDQVISVLHDVASWRSRRDEQSHAWLLVCEAHRELGHVDDAIECLRALERSGVMVAATASRTHALRKELEDKKTAEERLKVLAPNATLQVLDAGRGSAVRLK